MRLRVFLFAVVLYPMMVWSQTTSDAALWMSFSVDKKINKRQEIYAKTQSRLSDNFTTYNYTFIDIGLSNRITKKISFDVSYVLNTRRRYENECFVYIPRHQVYANATIKQEVGRFRFANRNQVQTDLEDGNFAGDNRIGTDYFYRNKTTIKYKPNKKIEPYFYYEWYLRMNNRRQWEDFIYRNRLCAGIEYSFRKRKSITCYYLFQQQIKRQGPDFVNAFGLAYNYSFKKAKRDA